MRYNFYMVRDQARFFFYIFFVFFILILFINLHLLSSNHNLILGIILSAFYFFLFYAFFFYWPDSFLPGLKIGDRFQIIADYLSGKNHRVVKVEKGFIEKNFLLLRKKPDHYFIEVDEQSVVIITDPNHHLTPLISGNHFISRHHRILHVLPKGLNLIQLGPLPEELFFPVSKTTGESLADFHARSRRFNLTRTSAKEGRILYPSFQILYRIKPEKNATMPDQNILGLAGELIQREFPIEMKPEIDRMISDAVLENWRGKIAKMDSGAINELIKSTPVMLEDFSIFFTQNDELLKYFNITIFLERVITNELENGR